MNKSKRFDIVKQYYDNGFWDIERVRDAVEHGWITKEEFELITEQKY